MVRAEFWPGVGLMKVNNDIRRVKQDDQMLSEISDRVHLQIRISEKYRSRFSNAEGRPHNGMVNIVQCTRIDNSREVALTRDLRHRRTDELALCEQGPYRCQQVRDHERQPAVSLARARQSGRQLLVPIRAKNRLLGHGSCCPRIIIVEHAHRQFLLMTR